MSKGLFRSYIIFMMLWLTACTDVAMTGAQAVYNRRSIQKNLNDQYITMQAYQALQKKKPLFDNANLTIATFNGEVLLAGQTPRPQQKEAAERVIKQVPEIQKIYNVIIIASPSSALKRISDAWITTKVKTKMIVSGELDPTQVKVVTENGTVYLMGMLRPSDAAEAVDIARTTEGVESVVKIFSYLRISKR